MKLPFVQCESGTSRGRPCSRGATKFYRSRKGEPHFIARCGHHFLGLKSFANTKPGSANYVLIPKADWLVARVMES